MIKKFAILIISILPLYVLNKLENLFSISQGKGFSDPERESKVVVNFLKKKKIILNNIFDIINNNYVPSSKLEHQAMDEMLDTYQASLSKSHLAIFLRLQ